MITNVDDLLEYGVFTNATQIKGVPVDDTNIRNGKVLAYNTNAHKLEYVENGGGTWGSITGTLADQTDLQTVLRGKASFSHTQAISTVTGLQTALDEKAPTSHTHTIADVTDLQTTLDSKVDEVVGKGLSTNDLTNELKEQYDQTVLDSHTHSNKTLLDSIINTGDGTKYLSNDGTYKTVQGGSGVDTFIELTDTPIDYIGQEGKYVRVNATANGLEFIEGTGGGVASFTQLNDVPTTYNNGANKFVKVKGDESGLEFVTETIPTKTSELTNDVGFVVDNNYVHTDNNYTTIEQTKLASIEEGAEENVQADWNTTDILDDSYIHNKPTIPTKTSDLLNDSQFVIDSNYVHTDNNYTTTEKDKLSGIQDGAEVNVNADWNSISGDSQILNKPSIIDNANTLANPTVQYTIKDNLLVPLNDNNIGVFSDVPDSKVGNGGKVLAVSQDETTHEYIDVSGGGATTFLELTDTPSTYTGNESKVVSVKADGTGLEFTTPSGGTSEYPKVMFKPMSSISDFTSLSDSAGRTGSAVATVPSYGAVSWGVYIIKLSETVYDIQFNLPLRIENTSITTGATYTLYAQINTGLGSTFTTANAKDVNNKTPQNRGVVTSQRPHWGGDFYVANGILYITCHCLNQFNATKSTFHFGLQDTEAWLRGKATIDIRGNTPIIPLPTL